MKDRTILLYYQKCIHVHVAKKAKLLCSTFECGYVLDLSRYGRGGCGY